MFRIPNTEQKISVVGRTGSGKTVFGAWVLSVSPFHLQPYIIVDYKGDQLLNSVDRIREIGLHEKLPERNGVYIVHPRPGIDDDATEKFLMRIWDHENIGIFFDEVYMVPNARLGQRGAFNGILTQGRSLHIPAIVLSQRPAWISGFVFSEADFIAAFHLTTPKDRSRVEEISGQDFSAILPDHWCRYYDVSRHELHIIKPVPEPAVIQQTLYDRLKPEERKRFF